MNIAFSSFLVIAALFLPAHANLFGQTATETIIIDNGERGYQESGVWSNSELPGYAGSRSRITLDPEAWSRWVPNLPSKGRYQIALFKVVHPNSTRTGRVEIQHSAGVSTRHVDFSINPQGWAHLGTFPFNGEPNESVKLSNPAGFGYLRADAVMFRPVDSLVIENEHAEYWEDGEWLTSNLPGYNGSQSRYTTDATATAGWDLLVDEDGYYSLAFYNLVHPNSTARANLTIEHLVDTEQVGVDQSSGQTGWVDLGTYEFESGQYYVEIDNLASEGYLRADSVRLEKTPLTFVNQLIDNGEHGYAERGEWHNSQILGADRTSTRASLDPDAVAIYELTSLSPGKYGVSFFQVSHANSTTDALVSIKDRNGSYERYLNQADGQSGWVPLGVYEFVGGAHEVIQLSNASGEGYLRADALKFERILQ